LDKEIILIAICSTELTAPRGIQANRLINGLLDSGIKINLITSKESLPSPIKKDFFTIKNLVSVYTHSSIVFKRSLIKRLMGKFISISLFYDKKFQDFAYKTSIKLLQDKPTIKTIITLSFPLAEVFSMLDLKKKKPEINWIAFFSDPLHYNPYLLKYSWEKVVYNRVLNNIFDCANHIVFPSEKMKTTLIDYKKKLNLKKIHIIPHSFVNENNYKVEPKSSKKIIIRYFGDLYGLRSPGCFLNALEQSSAENIQVEFYGNFSSYSRKIFSKYRHKNVYTFGRIQPNLVTDLLSTTSYLLLIDSDIYNSPFLPSKLIDYLSYNILIIGITPESGESYRVLSENNHFAIDNNNIEGIKSCIELLSKDESYKKRVINQNIDKYKIDSVVSEWNRVIC
jgi:hypothetical protein